MVNTPTIKKGYKLTEVGIIPEDWDVDVLASVVPRGMKNGIVDGPFGSNLKTIHYRKSGIPVITSGYVTEGKFSADHYIYVDKEKFEEEKRSAVMPGDIVMAKIGARCGASAILPHWHQIGILSGNALKITVDESRHSSLYIWQSLWDMYSTGRIEILRTVGAQPAISMAQLKKHRLALPPLAQQTAIATALEDVDALINKLGVLVEKKKNIKNGVMQELLTGKRRLSGFSGEWKTKKLGDIATIESGVNKPMSFIGKKGAVYITVMELYAGSRIAIESAGRIDVTNSEIEQYALKEGDIVFGKSSVKREGIGYPNIFRGYGEKVVFSGFTFRARVQPEIADPLFVIHALRTRETRNWVVNNSQASALTNLNSGIANNIPVVMPRDKKEQTAIAKVLSDMDAEIERLMSQLEKYRDLKQGMMQVLLTGKIRLVTN